MRIGFEVSSTEVATMLLPSRRANTGSTCNSGEDIAATPASSEVDGRPNWGMLASPVFTQKSDKYRSIQNLTLQQRKLCVKFFTHSNKCRETCVKQEKVKSRSTCFAGVLFAERENQS